MSWNPLKKTALAASTPRHVEVWGHLEENNRFLRRVTGAACAWAFVALALGAYGLFVGLYHPIAFFVDDDGRATYAGRLRAGDGPAEVEARYVARTFVEKFLGFNSLSIESDLSEAWNLMTDELRAEQQASLDELKAQQGKDFVTFIKEQSIQTVLAFDAAKTEVTAHDGSSFTVRLVGTARTWPLSRPGNNAPVAEKAFEALVTVVTCPRTEATPNGLLVAKVASRFFENDPETAAAGSR